MSMVKRILWNWLRLALALELAVAIIRAYLAVEGRTSEDFVLYSLAVVGAAGIIALGEELGGPGR
jgi:hypothetical protein